MNTQPTLFPLDEIKRERITTQRRASLIIQRRNDINENNKWPPLKEMLQETKRKFDACELPWQHKKSGFENLMMINDERN